MHSCLGGVGASVVTGRAEEGDGDMPLCSVLEAGLLVTMACGFRFFWIMLWEWALAPWYLSCWSSLGRVLHFPHQYVPCLCRGWLLRWLCFGRCGAAALVTLTAPVATGPGDSRSVPRHRF